MKLYTTRLPESTIKDMKHQALDEDLDLQEFVNQAIKDRIAKAKYRAELQKVYGEDGQ